MTDQTDQTADAVEDILSRLPADELAHRLGVDPQTALGAARAVISSLLGGMSHNAQDQTGEQALAKALLQHAGSDVVETGRIDLGRVDVADGDKIVSHVFGDQSGALAQAIGTRTEGGSALVDQLLPILAPVVLAYLAKRLTQGSGSPTGGGSILGDIVGGVLGGASQQAGRHGQGSGSVLGDILGGILASGPGEVSAVAPAQPSPQVAPGPSATADPDDDPGNLRIDDSAPTTRDGRPLPDSTQPAQTGILSDILGGILGKRT